MVNKKLREFEVLRMKNEKLREKVKKKLRELIKEKILWYELTNSGLRHINGGNVLVKNLRIRKDKAIANISHIEYDMGDGVFSEKRFKDCEYPLSLFDESEERE